MPSYPVKVWDGTQWVYTAAQPTDLTNYATKASPILTGNVGIRTSNIESGANVTLGRIDSSSEGGQVTFNRSTDDTPYWNIDVYGNTSTPSLRFFNESTVKMQIDSSGRITTPNQPMFFVYRGAGNTSLSGTGNILVPLDTKSYDVGSNYNASTYRFTAPIGGKYLFTFHLNIYGVTSNTFNAALRINGSTLHYGTRVITSSTGDWNSAVSAVVNLSANDYVEPIAYIGTATASISGGSATWNFFSGFLVG